MNDEYLKTTFMALVLFTLLFWYAGQLCAEVMVDSFTCRIAAINPEQPELPHPLGDNGSMRIPYGMAGDTGISGTAIHTATGPAAPSPSPSA